MTICYNIFFFKQKTEYEMRMSDWSSDVCSSDLHGSYTTPLTSSSCRPDSRSQPPSSDGLMKSRYWCVPFGSRRATYSAPTIASANAAGVRLSVDTNRRPPGLRSLAQADRHAPGSGTGPGNPMQVHDYKQQK